MPLQHAHIIDLIAQDPSSLEVVLGMTELRPWDGSDLRVYQLQEKVNAYLSFALDGEMAENFPQFADLIVRLELECVEPLDEKTAYFVGLIREQIGFQGVLFTVKVTPDLAEKSGAVAISGGGCCGGGGGNGNGGGCGCAGEAPAAAHEHHGHAHHHHHHGHNHGAQSGCCGGGGGASTEAASTGGGCGCAH